MHFRKKPVVIEAVLWDGSESALAEIIGLRSECQVRCSFPLLRPEPLRIETLEGEMTAQVGDWIIRGVKGELYPCRSDIFEQTYEAVDEKGGA
jgi:hypothetical protein